VTCSEGQRPLGAALHSPDEPNELSQWPDHDDSTINIVLVIIIIIIIILEWDRVCATRLTLCSYRLAIETGRWRRTPGNQRFCFVMVQTEKHVICFCPFSDHVLSQFDAVPFITNINKFFDSVDAGLVCCVWSCPFMNDVFWCDMLVYTMFVSLCYWQQCIMSLCPQILHFCQ